MRHEAGVAYIKDPIPSRDVILDRKKLATILANQEHIYEGKRVRSYHAVTRGWILNEIVCRVDPKRRTLGQIYEEDINAIPGIEFHLGLSPDNEARRSKCEDYPIPDLVIMESIKILTGTRQDNDLPLKALKNGSPLRYLIKLMLAMGLDFANNPLFLKTEVPSVNGFTNANSLAKIAAILAARGSLGKDRLMSRAAFDLALSDGVLAYDNFVCKEVTVTRGGFGMFKLEEIDVDTKFYGWPGMGGSIIIFNVEYNFGFSYVMNAQHVTILVDERARRLVVAAFKAHLSSL
ncbi:hypothetical protein DSO57_1000708 [Entomophthora muscae]|uniref:Uncharacterized protein n=1 Tax=Entomophthora muscae TaxID=34485 RepID=A0ACC2SMJ2_9FUNG|nr:hypothetical protein DSO57_1000708 [Entomophthora muscae]